MRLDLKLSREHSLDIKAFHLEDSLPRIKPQPHNHSNRPTVSTTSTALAVPTPPCCASCSTPRTSQEFIRNHIRTHIEPPDSDECRICWLPFGTVDTRVCVPDVACQIVNFPGCSHIFGWCCILKTIADGGTCCPMCRTAWFAASSDSPAHKLNTVCSLASRVSIDLISVRYYLFGEPALDAQVSDIMWSVVCRAGDKFKLIAQVMRTAKMADLVEDLADTQPSAVDHRLRDPYTMRQELYYGHNPFTFRNWQVSEGVLNVMHIKD
ncbi:hypothetical protein PTTW11_09704 [Pyrenophora teres f. teres]|uniref:RING-type domain-containing protein n=1 Tax=Pyrenophora teres f. teres TaxID=97479 RepID=A0A6S6WMI7_9PLEO|nr:hypothetical protein PTTW11_09704 [Pyrenophora teres f. teres]